MPEEYKPKKRDVNEVKTYAEAAKSNSPERKVKETKAPEQQPKPRYTPSRNNTANRKPIECYNCHKLGHIARDCRLPNNRRNSSSSSNSSNNSYNS
ncbi:hypothetical protein B4U80_14701, partial [Leptotrombidium deliense]